MRLRVNYFVVAILFLVVLASIAFLFHRTFLAKYIEVDEFELGNGYSIITTRSNHYEISIPYYCEVRRGEDEIVAPIAVYTHSPDSPEPKFVLFSDKNGNAFAVWCEGEPAGFVFFWNHRSGESWPGDLNWNAVEPLMANMHRWSSDK